MRLENRKDNHYKFYEISLIPSGDDDLWAVVVKWGSIGSRKPQTDQTVGDFKTCQRKFNEILKKRYRNGYEKIK